MIRNIIVILVNYNGDKDTIECLESILKLKYKTFQIIIIDNSELDSSLDKIISWAEGKISNITTKFPNLVYPLEKKPINYIRLNEDQLYKQKYDDKIILVKALNNKGFAAANNIGVKYFLKYYGLDDYVWLLNNDTVVDHDLLNNFSYYVNKVDDKVGIIGSNLYFYDNPNILQGYGGVYNSWLAKSDHLIQENTSINKLKIFEEKANYIIGASMFVSNQFIKEVGVMNEEYFLYYEEIDWSTRGMRKGWKIGYFPDGIIYHKEGASIGSNIKGKKRKDLADYYLIRNRILFTKKYYPKKIIFIYITFIIIIINRIIRGQYKRLNMIIKIIYNSFMNKF